MRETDSPTPEIPTDPLEVLHRLKQNPVFENRLMANFFEEKVDGKSAQVSQEGRVVALCGQANGSNLSLKLDNAFGANKWRLLVQNHYGNPDRSRYLAQINRQNMIGMDDQVGGLEGGFNGGLNHPDAADVFKILGEIADMNKRTRNINTILEGYPNVRSPIAMAYIRLIGKFSDPARLRVSEGHSATPPGQVAGIIDDPRMHLTSSIILNLHGRNFASGDKPYCWVHWSSDKREKFSYPLQTVFSYEPDTDSFSYGQNTEGLIPGTVRHEISGKMIEFLNGKPSAPALPQNF